MGRWAVPCGLEVRGWPFDFARCASSARGDKGGASLGVTRGRRRSVGAREASSLPRTIERCALRKTLYSLFLVANTQLQSLRVGDSVQPEAGAFAPLARCRVLMSRRLPYLNSLLVCSLEFDCDRSRPRSLR